MTNGPCGPPGAVSAAEEGLRPALPQLRATGGLAYHDQKGVFRIYSADERSLTYVA